MYSKIKIFNSSHKDKVIRNPNPGTYYITFENNNGCIIHDSIVVPQLDSV